MSSDSECSRGRRAPEDIPPPEYLPLLPQAEVPQGNVRLTKVKVSKRATLRAEPITPEKAAALPTKLRDQAPGLVYDPSKPGCDPTSWPYFCDEHETRRLCAPQS